MIKYIQFLFAVVLVVMCWLLPGCNYFPESSFELAPESRLPKWFTLPSGLSRSDVVVIMDYYITSSGRAATFTLQREKDHKELAKISGQQKGAEPLRLKNPPLGYPESYPSYEIITINGITEIIEHRRMEPIFYLSDDSAVWEELTSKKF